MYERFTDRARKVMQFANQEAQRFSHEYIGTEHVLLGLVKEGSGVAANVLKGLDIDLRKIRLEVEKAVQSGPDIVTMGKLPQTPRTKKVIEYSIEEARDLGHNYVGTEHLLLGLAREGDGVAYHVLRNLGVTLEDLRQEVLNLLGFDKEEEIRRLERKKERLVTDCDFEGAAQVREKIVAAKKGQGERHERAIKQIATVLLQHLKGDLSPEITLRCIKEVVQEAE